LLETATRIAIELDHPASDCLYIALAVENGARFVTSDESLVRKLDRQPTLRARVTSLKEAPGV
jgi:predicted nucleic acid-binding protein